jgi:hypothetical protein
VTNPAPSAVARPSPPERFARIIDELCKAIAAHGIRGLMTAPLLFLLWSRLKRMATRARALAARLDAGADLSVARQRRAAPRPARQPPPRLPYGVAWLIRMVPAAAPSGSQLRSLLTSPEMAALATAPSMRRLLRPLCRMLGVRPPPLSKRATPPLADPLPIVQPSPAPSLPPDDPPRRPPAPLRASPSTGIAPITA